MIFYPSLIHDTVIYILYQKTIPAMIQRFQALLPWNTVILGLTQTECNTFRFCSTNVAATALRWVRCASVRKQTTLVKNFQNPRTHVQVM